MTIPPTAVRRMGGLIAAVLVVALIALSGAGATSAAPVNGSDANGTYLALGDSVAFGYVPPSAVPAPKYLDAHSFVGYPEYLAQQLNERVSNASCPGETSASLLVAGAQSNGCENSLGSPVGYSTLYPLHVQYQGTQMAYALALHYLAAHKHTQLVTINIGANDALLCQATTPDHCSSPLELAGVANAIAANLTTVFHDLRVVAGYSGPIVVLTYYSLSYSNPAVLAGAQFLDSVLAGVTTANGGIVADGLDAFKGAFARLRRRPVCCRPADQAAGLQHPSVAGRSPAARGGDRRGDRSLSDLRRGGLSAAPPERMVSSSA